MRETTQASDFTMTPRIIAETLPMIAEAAHVDFTAALMHLLDGVFAIAGFLLLLAWYRARLRNPGAWSLEAAPNRPNHLADESVLLATGVYFLSALLVGVFFKWKPDGMSDLGSRLLGSIAMNLAGVAVCAWIAATRFEGGVYHMTVGTPRSRRSAGLLVAAAAIVAVGLCPLVAMGVVLGVRWVAPDFPFPTHPTLSALRDGDVSTALIAGLWFSAVVTAPLAEEFFFRGIVQTRLARVLDGRWRAIGVTSLAFGVVHAGQPHAMLPLVLFAVLLGYVYERTGALIYPLLLHAAFNAKNMLWETLGQGGSL